MCGSVKLSGFLFKELWGKKLSLLKLVGIKS